MQRTTLFGSLSVVLALCAFAGAADPSVDFTQAAKRGQTILERLDIEPATWISTHRLESGATFRVTLTTAGEQSYKAVEFQAGERWIPVLQLIERDGLWYAWSDDFARKCRPYELAAGLPVIYLVLDRAFPALITDPEQLAKGKLEKVENGTAILRHPLKPAMQLQIANVLFQLSKLKDQSPKLISPDQEKVVVRLQEWLDKGLPVHVDLATGIITGHGSQRIWTEISDFRFLPEVPKDAFVIEGRKWEDYSDDPTTGNVDNLAMIGFQPGFKLGQKRKETELVLVDVETGRFRRVPFEGIAASGGCFLPGRKSVLVHGQMAGPGGLVPYRIDLQSGENTPLAEETFRGAITMGATLSPDGKTVALARGNVGGILKSQIYLIDLDTDKSTPLGKPLDVFHLSWLPDGKRLLVRLIEYQGINEVGDRWIATMDLDGNLTKLFRGDAPFLAGKTPRIVFEDRATDLWSSCDLDGKDVQPYAGGLKGHGFPSPSPDGMQVLMMQFETGKLPTPILLDFGKSAGRPLSKAQGLWVQPAWK